MDWKDRDNQVLAFTEVHPSTPKQWVKARIFTNYRVSARRAKRLRERKRKRLKYQGSVLLNDTGRKSDVYCAWSPASLLHEVMLTDELLDFLSLDIERGNRVGKYNSDAVIRFGKLPVCCEMDLDTEGYDQVREQMAVYENAQIYNVWFAPTTARVEGLMAVGTPYSLYSVCGSRVWINAEKNVLTVDQILSLRTPAGA